MRVAIGWALIAVGTLVAAPASAQYGVVAWVPGGTPTCVPVAARTGSCPVSCPAGDVCRDVNPMQSVCAIDGALFCTSESVDMCPDDREREVVSSVARLLICIPNRAEVCPTRYPLADCFRTPPSPSGDTSFPVDWNAGDCDSDGLPNGPDPDPCAPPYDVAITSPGGDCGLAEPCAVDAMCPSGTLCDIIPGAEPHTYCVPADGRGVVPCCGGFVGFACPRGDACAPAILDDFGFCPDLEYCPDMPFFERVACLSYDGAFPVDEDEGDCDGDRVPNAEDDRPCTFDEFDAGVPTQDAGVPVDAGDVDAGDVDAGGAPMDGSVPDDIIPDFRGGSGCACRAAPSSRGGVAWLLGLLGLTALRRRRRSSLRA